MGTFAVNRVLRELFVKYFLCCFVDMCCGQMVLAGLVQVALCCCYVVRGIFAEIFGRESRESVKISFLECCAERGQCW